MGSGWAMFMGTDWTMFKDPVTTICAIIGAGLGIFNFVQSFHRGKLCMTQPMLIAFLFEKEEPKIFFPDHALCHWQTRPHHRSTVRQGKVDPIVKTKFGPQ
jgi:hypothetical protein